jgi:hypothetical protein
MDAFEVTVAKILEAQGYWIRSSYKINLTKEEKARVDKPSMPRPEIDLIAYRPVQNEILAVECKSLFDSPGVVAKHVFDPNPKSKHAKRYKMFNRTPLRELVLSRLAQQLCAERLCVSPPRVRLAMAVGHFRKDTDRDTLQQEFEKRGWLLFTDKWLRDNLMNLALNGYDNSIPIVTAKVLLRTPT